MSQRIIGERIGRQEGPLLIIFAQIHGNEPAGYLAAKEFLNAIDAERLSQPGFDLNGQVLCLRGNVKAVNAGKRFLKKDLNRSWLPVEVERIMADTTGELDAEDAEIKEILTIIHAYIAKYTPKKVVVLDLHTTTAHGGIFTIPAQDEEARRIGLSMHAPVLHGFLEGLRGTTLHYFTKNNFGLDITAVCFEAGQHNSLDSPEHAISAIISCCRAIGIFNENDVESKHDDLLLNKSLGLPLEANLLYVHSIKVSDAFKMVDTKVYNNFEPVERGEVVANDKYGPIAVREDGLILMPLYQNQGSDGFFIIKSISDRKGNE
jgi:succinylglutamate desuccinylase